MQRRQFLATSAGLIATGLASCAQSEKKPTIGVSVMTLGNPFFKVIGDNITSAAKTHGYETQVVDGAQDADKQFKQVEDFIVQEVQAIVLCPVDARAVGTAIAKANAAGIPVFTTDTACLDTKVKVECNIATDNYGGGKLAGEAMIEALQPNGGEVLILHYPQAQSCQDRVKGFTEVIDAYNADRESGKISIVLTLDGNGAKKKGRDATLDTLNNSKLNIAGIFAINDPSALGAYGALESSNATDKIKIISFDGQPEGKLAIRDGKIYAEPIQFPTVMAKKTVEQIMAYLNGEKIERELLIPAKLYRKADADQDEHINQWS